MVTSNKSDPCLRFFSSNVSLMLFRRTVEGAKFTGLAAEYALTSYKNFNVCDRHFSYLLQRPYA